MTEYLFLGVIHILYIEAAKINVTFKLKMCFLVTNIKPHPQAKKQFVIPVYHFHI